MAEALRNEGKHLGWYAKKGQELVSEDLKAKHGPGLKAPAMYFAGCTVSYVEHDIGMATVRLLDRAGVDFT